MTVADDVPRGDVIELTMKSEESRIYPGIARDAGAFGTPDEIRAALAAVKTAAALFTVEGGDHSFKVPKRGGASQDQVYDAVLDEIVRWLRTEVANP